MAHAIHKRKISLQFLGAAGQVTGSRTVLSVDDKRYLIDCGLFQGDKAVRERNWRPLPIDVDGIDAVILTHAHLDHSGYLPRLYREGYKRKILCSEGTAELCGLLLLDAAHLEEETANYANKTRYSRHDPAEPLFTIDDAEGALKLLSPRPRNAWQELGNGLSFRFLRAGHIIGASLIQFAISNGERTKFITFSGDLGHHRSHIMRGPVDLPESDVLILESTYGNRLHSRNNVLLELAAVVNRTLSRKGVLVIPAFAVGRAQELLHLLRQLEDASLIPTVPVILDSPMAAAATDIFLKHTEDQNLGYSFSRKSREFPPHRVEITRTPDESMLACMRDGPFIVISAAGMLSGGRILHHLKARLPDERNTVLFTGYQAEGTKGRYLQENAGNIHSLRIHHKEVSIEAEISSIDSLSAHADYEDVLDWFKASGVRPKWVFLNHGSPNAMEHLASCLIDLSDRVTPVLTEQEFDLSDL